jgi:hypothetical protein
MNAETGVDQTDVAAYVGEAMRGRLGDLRVLSRTAEGHRRDYGNEELEDVGLEFDTLDMEEDAADRLYEYPSAVEVTTTFEILLGTGGPDDWLCLECDGSPADWQPDPHTPPPSVIRDPPRPLPLLVVGQRGA